MEGNLKIAKAGPDHNGTSSFWKQVLGTTASSLISVCTGLTFGITAVMLPQLREDNSIQYDPSQDSWIASISCLSMIVGSLSSGQILDSFGRKPAHIILGIPFIIGWTFIACANSTDYICICVRGVISMCICVYGKKIAKKISFVASSFGASIFVFGLVTCLMMNFENVWVPVFCFTIYLGCSSAIVTIWATYIPELLPGNARGFGTGLIMAFGFLTLFFTVKFTPAYLNAYGESALFGFYGVSMLICGIILSFILPETDGKTLQCIEDSYNKKKTEQTHL